MTERMVAAGRLQAYRAPETHRAVSDLIRRHSTNPRDIREVALQGRDLAGVRSVLDLGCGFGYMAEVLAPRLPAEARVTGVDACPENREHFLSRLDAAEREGEFITLEVDRHLPFADEAFDLIVSSYSLYFFPGIVTDLARVISPRGRILALTHRESAVAALLRAAGLPEDSGPLAELARGFSGESGGSVLAPWFSSVEEQQYRNELVFLPEQREELFTYLRFKLRLMVECEESGEKPCSRFEEELRGNLAERLGRGPLHLPKDDTIFWASDPPKRS